MGPLAIDMVRAIRDDRLREAEKERLAAVLRGRKRTRRTRVEPAEPRRAPATVPSLQRLAHSADAVRVGGVIEVGGVAPVGSDGRVRYLGDAYRQTQQAIQVLRETLSAFGAGLDDVVRTRVYLKRSWQWEEVGRAHGDAFGAARPATTFVGAGGFPDADMLVAIEATAVVP